MSFISGKFRRIARYDTFIIPALWLFVAGNLLFWAVPDFPLLKWFILLPFLALLILLVVYSSRKWVIRSAFWLVMLMIGGFYYQQFAFQPNAFDPVWKAPHTRASVEGVVVRRDNNGHKGQIRVLNVNGQYASGITQITKTGRNLPLPSVGTTAVFYGSLKIPANSKFNGGFSYRLYLKTKKITTLLTHVSEITTTHTEPLTLPDQINRWMAGVREKMSRIFSQFLLSPDSDVLSGIVLGSHAVPIDASTKQAFIETGLIHFLAASGLNVGIIAGFILWLCGQFRVMGRSRLLIAMASVALYIMLAGVSPSVLRAGTMLELALFFKFMNQKFSLLFLLSLAVAIMVLFNPNVVGDLGFQFSVLSTFGLITMVPPLQELLGRYITRFLAGIILVPLIAQIWVLPLSLYHFNQFPLHSVPLNILAMFFVTPLTVIGFISGIIGFFWEPLGQWLTFLAWPFLKALLWIVQAGDQLQWAKISLASPPIWLVPSLYLTLGLILLFVNQTSPFTLNRRQQTVSILTLIFCMMANLSFNQWETHQQSAIEILPLSRFHSAFILKPKSGKSFSMLIPESLSYWEERTLSDYLKHRNIQHLSALALWKPPNQTRSTPSPLETLFVKRTVQQVIHLNQLSPSQTLRFGNLTLSPLVHQQGRLFQISSKNFCLLVTQRHNDTFLCPLTYLNLPRQPGRLWSTMTQKVFPVDQLRTVEITSRKLTLF